MGATRRPPNPHSNDLYTAARSVIAGRAARFLHRTSILLKFFICLTEPDAYSRDYTDVHVQRELRCFRMQKDELLNYYGYLTRLAGSKCATQADADDLVSETVLAALAFMRRGGMIEHPKTWLANTLIHKYNDMLRRKYSSPVIVNLDALPWLAGEDDAEFYASDEAAEVRRELLYLARTTREALIRYYYAGQSVCAIAFALGIPEGTVKSRLSAGREQIKKGLAMTEDQTTYIPGRLRISFSGGLGKNQRPISLVDEDLIAQSLLILAYDKPATDVELSRAIGIPTVYIEPIINKLVDGELMVRTDVGKVYSDFIIYKPEDSLSRFDAQLKFVRSHFDAFWSAMSEVIKRVDTLDISDSLNRRQLKKLERYAVLHMLQDFQSAGTGDIYERSKSKFSIPRRDGGSWTTMGWSYPAGFDIEQIRHIEEFEIAGHRTSGGERDFFGAKYLQLCEFDTTLWDSPARFTVCGFDNYFSGVVDLLWCIHKEMSPESAGIKNILIESIPGLENVGLLTHNRGKLAVDIPVIDHAVYEQVIILSTKHVVI